MSSPVRSIGAMGIVSALLAMLGASCCAIPLALSIAGVGTGAPGLLDPIHTAQPIFLVLAALSLGWGWFMMYRRGSGSALVVTLLAIGTLVLIATTTANLWDPTVTGWLTRR